MKGVIVPTRVQLWQDENRNAFLDLDNLLGFCRDPNILIALTALDDLISQAALLRTRAVKEARLQSATWEEIGQALRMSRQAAWDKYRKVIGEGEVEPAVPTTNGRV
jgi:hypothetical protein